MSQSKHTIKNLFTSSSLRIASAGRLLSENRTGTNPYVSTYTYTNRGQRATAFRSEKGVASHNGTYSYDDAGRLTNVADTVTASGLGGKYTWNADSTLASYPGPGYTRKLSYDEEGRLTKISRDTAGTITPVFEYGYGFDGNRRWRKDLAGNTWDWYPCGVACCAGELVTMRSTNGGARWAVTKTVLAANGMYSTNLGQALPRMSGQDSVIVDSSGQTDRMQNDSFGPRKFESLNTEARRNLLGDKDELSLALVMAAPVKAPCSDILKGIPKEVIDAWNKCMRENKNDEQKCKGIVKDKHLNAFIKYWACMASADLYSGTQPNIDPCSMKDLDTTYCGACCWQKQLQVAWQCRMKGSGLSWAVCMEKGRANFEECLAGCAF